MSVNKGLTKVLSGFSVSPFWPSSLGIYATVAVRCNSRRVRFTGGEAILAVLNTTKLVVATSACVVGGATSPPARSRAGLALLK